MEKFIKRAWAEINLDNIVYNYKLIENHLPENTKIMAVIKANANNLGDIMIAKTLNEFNNVCFAVSNIDEAITIRKTGTDKLILILGYTPVELATELAKYDITQAVISYDYGKLLEKECEKARVKVKCHFKLDTGMSRIGLVCYDEYFDEAIENATTLYKSKYLEFDGAFTHIATFYDLDEDSNLFTKLQFDRFIKFTNKLKEKGIRLNLLHCCNSPGTVNHPEMCLDMVRVGTAILGGLSTSYMEKVINFKEALVVKSVVACVKEVKENTYFGYSRTYMSSKNMKVATLPIGYSDICRIGLNQGYILVKGVKCPVIGGVCMDQLMIDVSDIEIIDIGDEVVLLGEMGDGKINIEEFAHFMGTTSEEAFCHLTKRLQNLYIQNEKITHYANFVASVQKIK